MINKIIIITQINIIIELKNKIQVSFVTLEAFKNMEPLLFYIP